jgi:hypothetical protein
MEYITMPDWKLGVAGFIFGLLIQGIIGVGFHLDPFDSLILLLLPGLPALIMTFLRPQRVWKWLIASTLSLPIAEIVNIFIYLPHNEFEKLIVKFSVITLIVGFIMSAGGVLIGWGINKAIRQVQLFQKEHHHEKT